MGLARQRLRDDGQRQATTRPDGVWATPIVDTRLHRPGRDAALVGRLEDEQGNKIQSPLVVLPPVQRIEPGKPSQIKIQALPAAKQLPQDRETLYYFNLREIPPKSNKPNTLQIALQTRIKLFYRPAAIVPNRTDMA
ncbi:fimbria/pilus periplasmic chaperone, partial [Escherichia coli]|uniref:fimbria/pilus periplasmic chaperone n=1 Tax=Escherichia coli TaxID=562 RepID=UPI0012903ADB